MNPCSRLADRMPQVARGPDQWTADEARHVETCPECQADWRLMVSVLELADTGDWEPDNDTITSGALARARHARSPGRRVPRLNVAAGLAAAAALVVATIQLLPRSEAVTGSPELVLASLPVPGLERLNEIQLRRLLDELDGPLLDDGTGTVTPELGSLDSAALAVVLTRLEAP